MKKLILLFVLMPFYFYAQSNSETESKELPVDAETKLVTYTDIVNIDSITAKRLYRRGKIYFSNKYKSAKDVIQLDDTTQIIGKAFTDIVYETGMFLSPTVIYKFNYTISLQLKDGRYKYTVSDFSVENYPTSVNGTYLKASKTPLEEWVTTKQKIKDIPEKRRKLWLKNYNMLAKTAENIVSELKSSMLKNEDW